MDKEESIEIDFDCIKFNKPEKCYVSVTKDIPNEYAEIGLNDRLLNAIPCEDIVIIKGLAQNGDEFLLKIRGKCIGWEYEQIGEDKC